MRHPSTLLGRAATLLTSTALVLAGSLVVSAAPATADLKRIETPFAYQGSAYGTRITLGGDPSQGGLTSGRTGWSMIGCTAMAPTAHRNFVASVGSADGIVIGAVQSTTNTYRAPARKAFGSRSVNSVADIALGPADGPQLKIGTLTTIAHAHNVAGKFGADTDINLGDVVALNVAPEGSDTPEQLQDLLDAIEDGKNQVIEQIITNAPEGGIHIPGLGRIYLAGKQKTPTGKNFAVANAFGIRVEMENGSEVNIGRAWAKIQRAHPAGVFAGRAYGLEGQLGDGVVGLGKTPFEPLPCIGTKGEWHRSPLVNVNIGGQVEATALRAETFGRPFDSGRAVARARAELANVTLGGGALELRGVVGQVNVVQNAKGRIVRRNINGTTVGAIIANDETHAAPAPGEKLEIPGVATIEAAVRTNIGKRAVRVHALRITLADGGAVITVGTAQVKIQR